MNMKHTAGALVTLLAFSGSLAVADIVTLDPIAVGSAEDSDSPWSTHPDGEYDVLRTLGEPLWVGWVFTDSTSSVGYRTRYEFVLPPELLQLGVTINRAALSMPIVDTLPIPNTLHLGALPADDVLTVDDFEFSFTIAEVPVESADLHHRFDVGPYLTSLGGSDSGRIGFIGAALFTPTLVEWAPEATLQVEYSPASPTLPGLSVFSPAQGAQYMDGSYVFLQARASDAQDGHIDASIHWEITTPEGYLVWQRTRSELSADLGPGTYQIAASVTDSDGNAVTHTRSVTVLPVQGGNVRPTLSIVSPSEGLELLDGIPTPFQATASDPEDGDITDRIEWIRNDMESLGYGGSVSAVLPAGAHSIRVVVGDSGGRFTEKEINVNVVPAPSYCAAGGGTNPSQYISAVGLNGDTKVSSYNGGYGDFTATWFNAVKGANTIALNAAGGQSVYWTVWIDLNRDGAFSADEALSKGRGNGSSINPTLTIPATAITGVTRMRVSALYSGWPTACGAGNSSETEDYTVVIE